MRIRLRDVAEAVGVSDATVSLALAGSPRISDETRRRVEIAAEQMRYRPNRAARALRTESTQTLGLIVSDVANPFFSELAGAVERICATAGYSVMLCNSDEDESRQDAYLRELLGGGQADGVLLVPVSSMTAGLQAAGSDGAKLVLLDRPITVTDDGKSADHLGALPVIRSDPTQALRECAQMLRSLGHRRVGIITPPLDVPIGQGRRDEICEALLAAGLSASDILIEQGDFRQESGERATTALMQRSGPPTAIIAADGLMGVGAMKALRARSLRIPDDVSLLCFDDAPWFELFDPPMTAIAQPVNELARSAVTALLAMVEGSPSEGQPSWRPACTFIPRSSCGPPGGTPTNTQHRQKTPEKELRK